MLKTVCFLAGALAALAACAAPPERDATKVRVFRGASDASGAEFLDAETIVVGDDEENLLRVYRPAEAGSPIDAVDLSGFLAVDRAHPEADIEGAARAGDRIYWVTSHGLSRKGEVRQSRDRFFATTVVKLDNHLTVTPTGKPCATLGPAIATAFEKAKLPLRDLNIEALAATPDGKTLYLGLRGPSAERDGKRLAIVLPFRNPAKVVEDGVAPDLGEPLLWDLGGRVLRSLEYSEAHRAYFAVASPVGDAPGWALFRWSGVAASAPVPVSDRGPHGPDIQPEAMAVVPGTKRLLLLTDDGVRRIPVARREDCKKSGYDGSTCRNKDLKDPAKRSFRGFEIEP